MIGGRAARRELRMAWRISGCAAFGFAPEFRVGRAPGHMSALGIEFDAIYGETADYEFASEMPAGAPGGRG
jgi:hypothetical protein